MKNQKKKLIFNLKEGFNAEEILKKINSVISSQEAVIKIENEKLTISFLVSPRDINYIKTKIKEILSYESNKNKVVGFKYNIKDLVPLGKDFLEILLFLLNKLGYASTIDEERNLITTAKREKVESLIRDLENNLKGLSTKNYSNALKKAIACILTLRKRNIEDANSFINEGFNLGILEENKNKIYTKYSWKEACEKLSKVY